MKKLFLMAAAVVCTCTALAAKYVKVTSNPATFWTGEYILVYEATDSAYVYTGVYTPRNYTPAIVANDTIEGTFITLTIAGYAPKGSMKVNGGKNDGKYLIGKEGNNMTSFSASAHENTIEYDKTSKSIVITSNTSVMRFNTQAKKFTFYQASSYSLQQPVQLYKFVEGTGDSIVTILDDCATVNAETTTGVAYKLNEVTVVYVNGANIYVKDESGSALVYMANSGLVAGDKVSGIQGTSAPYQGLPELKPTNTASAWTITHGTAPEIPVAEAAPVAEDVNMVLTWKNVSISGEFTSASKTNLIGKFGEDNLTIRNNFQIAQTFTAGKTYDITAAVALYNGAVQLYFISAVEHSEPTTAIDEVTIDNNRVYKTIEDGQVVLYRDGVRYNTLGQKLTK